MSENDRPGNDRSSGHEGWQRPAEIPAHEHAPEAPAVTPASTGEPVTASQPVYGSSPADSPMWTPYGSAPQPAPRKRMPTAAKVAVGGVAAVALALCSGVTGAVVATAIHDRDFSLPISTAGVAPVVDRSSLAGVAAKIQPSVVSIRTSGGEGSGVILTEDGYILTNNHVVESARGGDVTVTLANGKKVQAKVIGTDPRTDLGVVKAGVTGLTAATLGDSDKTAVGDTVLAIGSPLGLEGSVTSGIISAKDRTLRPNQNAGTLSGLLQTDAPINPGNSGGALVNMNGDVIGINTAIATSGDSEGNIGLGFAIPSNKAKQVAEQLIKGQKVSHAFLGVSVSPVDTGGARIDQITPNSAAAQAGLQTGDIITKFGDRVVNGSNDLVNAVQSGSVGQKVTVEFIRNGETQHATVTLGEAS
jgi:putative serine protease PepD